MKGSFLGEFEEVVLLAVCVLKGELAYANEIRKEVEKHTARTINLSAIHSALYRMERKGFLDSQLAEASPRRGGKRKRYFEVSKKGFDALCEVKRIRESFWKLVPVSQVKGGTL
ncbi:PadR family transcriptional regulator [Roseivirga sp. 4D4]|uniref:PadR family transcriptional regulator n=1 Tax=Roseivirga sp. 4D4 TaxID=1889784 RepID=UPI0008531317|nr:PadR family transcriptional regulator [Roseivirga sp. 4D4]OEK00004.1 PadR family transcriptional regulator [Roseivirga sp. 4D4]